MGGTGHDELIARAHRLAATTDRDIPPTARSPRRVIIGIAGCPGAGKSTLASWLADALRSDGLPAVWVPMDGFHLADAELERLGRRHRMGAIDTFDVHGYGALLRRITAERSNNVYAPGFDREIEQPVAGAIAVSPDTRVVVTEGNYLLVDDPAWRQVRAAMTEVWYVELDDQVRVERLVRRHIEFGKSPAKAQRWVDEVDEPNAALIRTGRGRADLVIDVGAGWQTQRYG